MTKIEVQYINKVLVKETFALVFISIDFKAFLVLLEVNSHGKTSATLVFCCGFKVYILGCKSRVSVRCCGRLQLLFTFSRLPIAFRSTGIAYGGTFVYVFQMFQNL